MARLPLEAKHTDFTNWAVKKGVSINGVEPTSFVGRGLGLCATQRLQKNQVLLIIPARVLFTARQAVKLNLADGCSEQARLAAALAQGTSHLNCWSRTWPSVSDFSTSIPMRWPGYLCELLPPTAKELLATQTKRYQKDWNSVQHLLGDASREAFSYYWLIANTRSMHWNFASQREQERKRRHNRKQETRQVLCPFLDYCNHANQGCIVTSDATGFTLTADRDYEVGEEIHVCYGRHSNDALLVEYGFIFDENDCQELKLDHLICPRLSESQRNVLESSGFLRNYTIDPHETCHRTSVALRVLLLPSASAQYYINTGEDLSDNAQVKVNVQLMQLVRSYLDEARQALRSLGELEPRGRCAGKEKEPEKTVEMEEERRWKEQRDVLVRRWEQIEALLDHAIERMKKDQDARVISQKQGVQ